MTTTTDYAELYHRAVQAVRDAERNWNEIPASRRAEADAAWYEWQAALAKLEAVRQAAREAREGRRAR